MAVSPSVGWLQAIQAVRDHGAHQKCRYWKQVGMHRRQPAAVFRPDPVKINENPGRRGGDTSLDGVFVDELGEGMTRDWTVDDPDLARLIAENSSDVICRLDNFGVIRWVAAPVSASIGWTADQLLDHPMLDFVDPADVALASALGEGVSAGHTVGAEPDQRPALRWRTPDGGVRWMSGAGIPETDSNGRLIGAIVTLRDVTDLVDARLKAEAYAQQWQATVENMLDPFVVLTAVRGDSGDICDFTFTIANAAAAADQNVALEDLVGSGLLTLFPHAKYDGLFAAYVEVVETGAPLILDDTEVFNDVLAQSRRYDIRGAKTADSLVLTWRDVTERHAIQKRLAARGRVPHGDGECLRRGDPGGRAGAGAVGLSLLPESEWVQPGRLGRTVCFRAGGARRSRAGRGRLRSGVVRPPRTAQSSANGDGRWRTPVGRAS
jgi:PAS domain S-box-containing protein